MTLQGGNRDLTAKERERNKRRQYKRRAIASRIFVGLRQYAVKEGKLSNKQCDNNELLKALCRETGYIVEEDESTSHKPLLTVKGPQKGQI